MPAADNVMRLLPALTITDDEIAEASPPGPRRRQPVFRVKYPGGLGASPQPAPESKDDMTHFLDIHTTPPADLRA